MLQLQVHFCKLARVWHNLGIMAALSSALTSPSRPAVLDMIVLHAGFKPRISCGSVCTAGLGFEVAKQLLLKGHEVMLACRSAQKGQQAVQKLQQQQQQSGLPQGASAAAAAGNAGASQNPSTATTSSSKSVTSTTVSAVECDLSSLSSVRSCAAAVQQQWPAFDVLVCNAAVIPNQHSITADGIEQQLQVNHLSHMLLVDLLLPCLVAAADARTAANKQQQQQGGVVASSRVVVVGSTQHMSVPEEFQDPQKLELLLPGGSEQQQQQQQAAVLPPMKL